MESTPLDRDEYRRWRRDAEQSLASAELQAEAGLHNLACFAAEQAAQLALKAILHGLGRGPWGHDLVALGVAAGEAGLELPADIGRALKHLARHYIPARYADAHAAGSAADHYDTEDSRQAVGEARAVLAYVDSAWESLGA